MLSVLRQLKELKQEVKVIRQLLEEEKLVAEEGLEGLLPGGAQLATVEELQNFEALLDDGNFRKKVVCTLNE